MANDSDSKIKIYYHDDQFLVWNADDALKLRIKHRIVGTLIGSYPGEQHQVNRNGLPLQLMEMETKLLIDNQVADLIQIELQITPEIVGTYDKHVVGAQHIYSGLATDARIKEIQSHLSSKSAETRRGRKKSKIDDPNDVADASDREMDDKRISIQTMNNSLLPVQIFTECPWPRKEEIMNGKWLYPRNERERLLYNVFRDLWKRGFYITNGFKYGCDYLAYEADPLLFHSKYMVLCQLQMDDLKGLQFLVLNRVSGQSRKQLLIASIADGKSSPNAQQNVNQTGDCKPIYVSIDWTGNIDAPFKRFNSRPKISF